jgi:hypothetical protein
MKSDLVGKTTLDVEVTQIDMKGIWVLIGDNESFLPFEKFPYFKDATVSAIHNVQLVDERELHWPDLDVDLSVDEID